MYFRRIETDREVAAQHNESQKANAADRLKKVAALKKLKKPAK